MGGAKPFVRAKGMSMLFLIFQLGAERYALPASKVVEVVPLLNLKRIPHAPAGLAGVFIYRGRPVPALDISEVTLGCPAAQRLSTRIIIVNYQDAAGQGNLLGLIAERATDMLREDMAAFINPGIKIEGAKYLGPVLTDAKGPIQLLYEQHLVSEPVRRLLSSSNTRLALSAKSDLVAADSPARPASPE
jgi:chemotaxis-related protein WspB